MNQRQKFVEAYTSLNECLFQAYTDLNEILGNATAVLGCASPGCQLTSLDMIAIFLENAGKTRYKDEFGLTRFIEATNGLRKSGVEYPLDIYTRGYKAFIAYAENVPNVIRRTSKDEVSLKNMLKSTIHSGMELKVIVSKISNDFDRMYEHMIGGRPPKEFVGGLNREDCLKVETMLQEGGLLNIDDDVDIAT